VDGEIGRGDLRLVLTLAIDRSLPLCMAHRRGKSPSKTQIRLMNLLKQAFKADQHNGGFREAGRNFASARTSRPLH
jgi:hypothetical protein